MSKKLTSALAAAILGAAALSTPVMAGTSATAGFVSDYVFRGNNLGNAGANGSINWANEGGFSLGAWAIDDNSDGGATGEDGMEVDLYGAYGQKSDDLSWSVGFTRYQYTYGQQYEQEINLDLGYQAFALGVDVGQGEANVAGPSSEDFTHASLSWSPNAIYTVLVATFDAEADDDAASSYFTGGDYDYAEVSAKGKVSELDVALTLGATNDDTKNDDDGYMTISVSKTFDGLGF